MPSERPTIWLADELVWIANPARGDEPRTSNRKVDLPGSLFPDESLEPLRDAIRNMVDQIGPPTQPARLVIPATWAFIQHIERPPGRYRPDIAACDLEGYLPVTLEDVTTAFVPADDGGLWGIAVPTAPLTRLLDGLQSQGVLIDVITLDALMAVRGVEKEQASLLVDARHVALCVPGSNQGGIRLLRAVRTAPSNSRSIGSEVRLWERMEGERFVWQMIGALDEKETTSLGRQIQLADASSISFETLLSESGSEGPSEENLRSGRLAFPGRFVGLYRHSARCAVLAALVFLALGGRWGGQRRTDALSLDRLAGLEAEVYREVFPGRKVPPAAALRLASERKKLTAVTRGEPRDDSTDELETGVPVLQMFRHAAASIPPDDPVFLNDLTLSEKEIFVRGLTRDHPSSERIAKSLGTISGLRALPARSETRSEGGVDFSIRVLVEVPVHD